MLGTLKPDSARPAEQWFLGIREGYTPRNSQVSAITVGWVEEWLAERQDRTMRTGKARVAKTKPAKSAPRRGK